MNSIFDFFINCIAILAMLICVIALGTITFILVQYIFELDCNNILSIKGIVNGEV